MRLAVGGRMKIVTFAALLWFWLGARLFAGIGGLSEVEFDKLSDTRVSTLGGAALAISPNAWKHAETANFIYHYRRSFVATPVSVEAEFYYRVVAAELGRDTTRWERKSHIFIFESPEDWAIFQKLARLDPWTGGIHAGGELFIVRDPRFKWKGSTLAHEVTHLVLHRFFGSGLPLWLNEGYAEYAAGRAYASYHRARGAEARPRSAAVAAGDYIALAALTGAAAYPATTREVAAFYAESERLVRYLSREGRPELVEFMDALAGGARLETALGRAFGTRFPSLERLEGEFKKYATDE